MLVKIYKVFKLQSYKKFTCLKRAKLTVFEICVSEHFPARAGIFEWPTILVSDISDVSEKNDIFVFSEDLCKKIWGNP